MARRNARTGAETIRFDSATQHFQNWAYGTVAVAMRMVNDPGGGTFNGLFGNTKSGGGDDGFSIFFESAHVPELWSATANAAAISGGSAIVVADGWVLVVITKTTGATTPRAHIFKWSAGTWNHANFGAALADNVSFQTPVNIGRTDAANNEIDCDLAAIMALNQYVMTDSEVERLPRGSWRRWLRRGDDFLIEFPSGHDRVQTGVATSARTIGCGLMRSTTVTGTTRS